MARSASPGREANPIRISVPLVALALLIPLAPSPVAATGVGGGIFADTTWTTAGSPYDATASIIVQPGVTLTIEPGVTVRFAADTTLEVRGALVANGTAAQPIVLTSAAQSTRFDWNGISIDTGQGGRAQLRHIDLSHASSGVDLSCCWGGGPVTLDRSVIHDSGTALAGYAGWAMRVDNSTFRHNYCGASAADKIIWGSSFLNNTYGLCQTERVSVYDSVFMGNSVALHGGRGELKFSRIEANEVGLRAFYEGFAASYNTIANNTVGVEFGFAPWPLLARNNLLGASTFDLSNLGSYAQNAGDNYWGTTNATLVASRIHDALDDPMRGLVNASPLREYPIPTHPNRSPLGVIAPVAPAECSALRGVVSLDASASTDPDGDALHFEWSAPSGGVSFSDPRAAKTSATLPLGTTFLIVRVTDGGEVSTVGVNALVRDTLPPSVALVRPAADTLYAFDEPLANVSTGAGPVAIGPLTLIAQPHDQCGVESVRFLGEETNATVPAAPYAVTSNPNSTGSVVWRAIARDHAGRTSQANATFVHAGTAALIDACSAALADGACAAFADRRAPAALVDATCRTLLAPEICDAARDAAGAA